MEKKVRTKMATQKRKRKNLVMSDVKIVFRNFSGEEQKYNREGDRNFAVVIDDLEYAAQLKEDGWNIKYFKPRDEEDIPNAYLPVAVSYKNIPPTIKLITRRGHTVLDPNTVGTLDWADIKMVDLTISPSYWEVNGNTGIKAYVKTMYVAVVEDEFAAKWADGYYPDDDDDDFDEYED